MKETEKNLALRVEDTDSADSFLVFGRGILHLGILIETMRREGFELTIGQPQVLVKEIDGKKNEPYENLVVDVPQDFSGKVIDLVTQRKGEMLIMETKGTMQHLEFEIPSRGLIGLAFNDAYQHCRRSGYGSPFHRIQTMERSYPRKKQWCIDL